MIKTMYFYYWSIAGSSSEKRRPPMLKPQTITLFQILLFATFNAQAQPYISKDPLVVGTLKMVEEKYRCHCPEAGDLTWIAEYRDNQRTQILFRCSKPESESLKKYGLQEFRVRFTTKAIDPADVDAVETIEFLDVQAI